MEENGIKKLYSTRFLLALFIATLGFVACIIRAANLVVLVTFLAGVFGTYVTGNTISKNTMIKANGGK